MPTYPVVDNLQLFGRAHGQTSNIFDALINAGYNALRVIFSTQPTTAGEKAIASRSYVQYTLYI